MKWVKEIEVSITINMESDINRSASQADSKPINQIYQEINKICKKMIKYKTYPYLNIPIKLYKRDFMGISPNLSYLALFSCSSNNEAVNKLQIEIFDTRKSKSYLEISLKKRDQLPKVCFSFDEKYMIIASHLQDIEIWDLNNKRIEFIIKHSFKSEPLYETISCSDYNLGFGTKNSRVQIWSLTEKCFLFEGLMHKPSICFSPNNQLLGFSNNEGRIRIMNMKKEKILSLDTYEHIIKMAFSQNSKILICSLSNKNLILYNIKSKNEVCRWKTNDKQVRDFSISYERDLLRYFDLDSISNSAYLIQNFSSNNMKKFQKWGVINEEIIELGKSCLILNVNDCNPRLIDFRMMREQIVIVNKTKAKSLAFSPDCKWLAIGLHLKVKMIRIKDKKENWEFDAYGNVSSLKFSADSHFLGFWAYPKIEIRNVSEKYSVFSVCDYSFRIISFDISRDNKYLALGSNNCISVHNLHGEETKYERSLFLKYLKL